MRSNKPHRESQLFHDSPPAQYKLSILIYSWKHYSYLKVSVHLFALYSITLFPPPHKLSREDYEMKSGLHILSLRISPGTQGNPLILDDRTCDDKHDYCTMRLHLPTMSYTNETVSRRQVQETIQDVERSKFLVSLRSDRDSFGNAR